MGTLGALVQNEEAFAYATHRLRQNAKYKLIINELSAQFGISISYMGFKTLMWRRNKDDIISRNRMADNDRRQVDEKIKGDVRAGFSHLEIAKRYGLTVRQVQHAIQYGDYVSEKDDLLRRALQDRRRRPKWMDRPIDDHAIDGPLTSAGKIFLELGDHECRYSIGKDEDGVLRFCGKPRAMDGRLLRRPYCEKHGDLAVIPQNAQCEIEDWMLDGYAPGNRRPS